MGTSIPSAGGGWGRGKLGLLVALCVSLKVATDNLCLSLLLLGYPQGLPKLLASPGIWGLWGSCGRQQF